MRSDGFFSKQHDRPTPYCRVAYGKVEVFEDGICEADLFVQDAELCRVSDP